MENNDKTFNYLNAKMTDIIYITLLKSHEFILRLFQIDLLHLALHSTPNVITPNVINLLFQAISAHKSQFLGWGRGCGNGEER